MGLGGSYSQPAAPKKPASSGGTGRALPGQAPETGTPGTLGGPVARGEPPWPQGFLDGMQPPEGAGSAPVDPADWTLWWHHNGEHYLRVGAALAAREVISGDQGGRRGEFPVALRDEIVSVLQSVLRQGGEPDLLRQGLMALARLERRYGASKLGSLDTFALHYLREGMPAAQEAALLALGVQGEPRMVPLLRAVLDNTHRGRVLTGTETVPVRLRAHAAYALGLLGEGACGDVLRLSVVHSLLDALGNERTATREIQVACVLAMGLVPLEYCRNDPAVLERHRMEDDRHLCGGAQLRYLLDIVRNEELDPWVRAHAAPATGRLSLAAPAHFRAAVFEELGTRLGMRSGEPDYVRQGCVLGLGLLADGDGDEVDVEARRMLAGLSRRGDPLARRLALIGLGRAAAHDGNGGGGGRGREETEALLLGELARGRRDRKSWAALALGVFGYGRNEGRGEVSDPIRHGLRAALERARTPREAAAPVLAIGMLRDEESGAAVRDSLRRFEDPAFRVCAALTLGLLAHPEGLAPVREAFLAADRPLHELRPEVAFALRLLGDDDVAVRVLARFDCTEDGEERTSLARLLGNLGDPRAVPALLTAAGNLEQDVALRAAAIRGLADLCDGYEPAWTTAYSTDILYGVLTWTLVSPLEDAWGLLDWR